MLRLLADENFNGDIVRALLLRQPNLHIVRVQDVGLTGVSDPDLLAWAAANNRIISYARPCDLTRLCILNASPAAKICRAFSS
jgi:predicted nuclease of predicted toxin-antitoxin system